MTPRVLLRPPGTQSPAKAPFRASAGHLTATSSVMHTDRAGVETTALESPKTVQLIPGPEPSQQPLAKAKLSLGLTIPGPPKSFMAARIDIGIEVPCLDNDDSIRAAMARASALVEEQLEVRSAEITRYFNS